MTPKTMFPWDNVHHNSDYTVKIDLNNGSTMTFYTNERPKVTDIAITVKNCNDEYYFNLSIVNSYSILENLDF